MSQGDIISSSNLTENMETLQKDIVPGTIQQSSLQASNVTTISHLCDQETVLQSGTVNATASKGTTIWEYENAPAKLQSTTQMTRLSQVSQNFVFWTGTIHYRMVFTKTILQQTKFIVYWVPDGVANPTTVDEAIMLQHHVIINPDNAAHVDFQVPFISTKPYHRVDELTGRVLCRLFQPIVNSVDGGETNLQYTLFIKSADVVFRDLKPLPPPAGGSVLVPNFQASYAPLLVFATGSRSLVDFANPITLYSDNSVAYVRTRAALTTTEPVVAWKAIVNDPTIPSELAPFAYLANTCRTVEGEPIPGTVPVIARHMFVYTSSGTGAPVVDVVWCASSASTSWLNISVVRTLPVSQRIVAVNEGLQLPNLGAPPALASFFQSEVGAALYALLEEKAAKDPIPPPRRQSRSGFYREVQKQKLLRQLGHPGFDYPESRPPPRNCGDEFSCAWINSDVEPDFLRVCKGTCINALTDHPYDGDVESEHCGITPPVFESKVSTPDTLTPTGQSQMGQKLNKPKTLMGAAARLLFNE